MHQKPYLTKDYKCTKNATCSSTYIRW